MAVGTDTTVAVGGRVGATVRVGAAGIAVDVAVGMTGVAVSGAVVGDGGRTDVAVREGCRVNVGMTVIVGAGNRVGVCAKGPQPVAARQRAASAMPAATTRRRMTMRCPLLGLLLNALVEAAVVLCDLMVVAVRQCPPCVCVRCDVQSMSRR